MLTLFYEFDTLITTVIGTTIAIISAIIAFHSTKKDDNTWNKKVLIITIITIAIDAIVMIAIFTVKYNYTKVPNIEKEELELAKSKITAADLKYSDEDLYHDDGDVKYCIKSVTPSEGSVQKKETVLRLQLIKASDIYIRPQKLDSGSEEAIEELYDNLKSSDSHGYGLNSDELTLSIGDKAIGIVTDDKDFDSNIITSNLDRATVQLIDYNSKKTVREGYADSSNDYTVKFNNLKTGTYYYKVSSPGYYTYVPEQPFKLDYDSKYKKDELSWLVSLGKKDAKYYAPFKIKVVDQSGNPIVKKDFEAFAISKNGESLNSYSVETVTSDKNGYLSTWMNENGVDYYKQIKFEVNKEYQLVLNANGNDIKVDCSSGKSEYVLKLR
ncbi:hypothetical protein D3Z38_18465 [Clostridiales bacterium]|nr:hypothetical protein [Clostridiales bacterium]